MAAKLLLSLILYISQTTLIQSSQHIQPICTEISDQSECGDTDGCKYNSDSGVCQCATETELDLLFAIDASGSISSPHWQTMKSFIAELVQNSISHTTRIGFFIFDTYVNESRHIQAWESKEALTLYIQHMYHRGGYTNTPEALNRSIVEFKRVSNIDSDEYDRQQLLLIITDGNPTIEGSDNISVCGYAPTLKEANIQVIIVGVGDEINEERMLCLTDADSDFIHVNAFTQVDFESVAGSIEYKVCPSKKVKIDKIIKKKLDLIPIISGLDAKYVIGGIILLVIICIMCVVLIIFGCKKRKPNSVKDFAKTMKEQEAMFAVKSEVADDSEDDDVAVEDDNEEKENYLMTKNKATKDFEETMKQQNAMFDL